MTDIAKIVLVTQETWLDGLIHKYNTKEQARFYIEHSGGSFDEYLDQHLTYYSAIKKLKKQLPTSIRSQTVDKSFLPNFIFGPQDLVIVLGRDGLVINTAKYLDNQPLLGVNPDPKRVDGVLLQFTVDQINTAISRIEDGSLEVGNITMIEAVLNNGQRIVGVNDIFIGHQSHKSARYTLKFDDKVECQSSSGIIISSGIGSTGWMKSIISTSLRIASEFETVSGQPDTTRNFDWESNYLRFAVREAWKSGSTGNSLVFGTINGFKQLVIESNMPEGGVIFSDGMEEDRISFNSGRTVRIGVCPRKIRYYRAMN